MTSSPPTSAESERPMIGSLLWKEWSEQRWKLLLGTAMLAGFTLIGLRTRLGPDIAFIAAGGILYAFVFPMFVAMDVIAGDRAEGGLGALLALPLPAWKVLA